MSYKATLEAYMEGGRKVVIERAEADDVVGTIDDVCDDGCTIRRTALLNTCTFVSHRDIRGVSTDEWDLKHEG